MSTALALVENEVLDSGQPTLEELAATANREHALALEAGASMLHHAIRVGEALLLVRERCSYGEWRPWIDANLDIGYAQTSTYMRVARYKDKVLSGPAANITEARRFLLTAPGAPSGNDAGSTRMPAWVREEAQRMADEGVSKYVIADELGVSVTTVYRWTDPTFLDRNNRKMREAAARRRAADRALREAERAVEIKRAVRKAGAATAEAWSMAERFQDVIAQAHDETQDSEARAALARAGEHYRKMRDEIVRALGVQ